MKQKQDDVGFISYKVKTFFLSLALSFAHKYPQTTYIVSESKKTLRHLHKGLAADERGSRGQKKNCIQRVWEIFCSDYE